MLSLGERKETKEREKELSRMRRNKKRQIKRMKKDCETWRKSESGKKSEILTP